MTMDGEYLAAVNKSWDEAWELATSTDGWKQEKTDSKTGDLIESKKNAKGRKVYRCKATVAMPPKLLIDALSDTNTVTEWNLTLKLSKVIHEINKDVAISYQVTGDSGGGMVSSRDFVYCAKKGYKGDVFFMGGSSVEYADAPTDSKIVRAINGPGGHMVSPGPDGENSCNLVWLMDCDYKGWMPQGILDMAMPVAQTQFIESVRKLAKKLQEEGKF